MLSNIGILLGGSGLSSRVTDSMPCFVMLNFLIGKGNGNIRCYAEEDSYWPFESKEQAFEFLEKEFGAPLTGSLSYSDSEVLEKPSYIIRHISPKALSIFLEEHRKKVRLERDTINRTNMRPFRLRHELRCLNTESDAKALFHYAVKYYHYCFPLGYILVDDRPKWFNLVVRKGSLGKTLWKRAYDDKHDIDIIGMTIGMLGETSYFVMVEPGGRIFLVYDLEDETGGDDAIPWTVVPIFDRVDDIGTAFNLECGYNIEKFQIDDLGEDELGNDYLPLILASQDNMTDIE
jgi:hypothetical protein